MTHFARSLSALTLITSISVAQVQELWTQPSPNGNGSRDFGSAIATGDVNADGFPDIVVGDHDANQNEGAVYVYSGNNRSLLYTFSGLPGDHFGWDVACGDINGDGYDDIAFSTLRDAGPEQVFIYSGQTGTLLSHLSGSNVQGFGRSIAIAKYNNDAYADLAVGIPLHNIASVTGRVTVHYGPTLGGTTHYDGEIGEGLGNDVSNVGDLDGNGTEEFAMCAPYYSTQTNAIVGRVYVRGRSGSTHKLLGTLIGTHPQDAGNRCQAVGDVDGDGLVDLAVGNAFADRNGNSNSGFLAVYSRRLSPPSGTTWSIIHNISGIASESKYGRSFGAAGDVDGDGKDDIAVSHFDKVLGLGPEFMHVDVLSGDTGSAIASWHYGSNANGSAIHPIDINRNGLPGFVFGDASSQDFKVFGWAQTYSLPGTGDDFVLRSGLQGATPNRYDVKSVDTGEAIGMHVLSPNGTYNQSAPVVIGQIVARDQVPSGLPGFPGLQVEASVPLYSLYNMLNSPFGTPLLGSAGVHIGIAVSPALSGFDIIVQGVCMAPSQAISAPLACTEAHRFQIQ